jgi:hypothetical protein
MKNSMIIIAILLFIVVIKKEMNLPPPTTICGRPAPLFTGSDTNSKIIYLNQSNMFITEMKKHY